MDKECRDLRRKEQRTPKKPKKPPSLNEEFEEDDKENQEGGGVGQEDGAKKELFSSDEFSHPVYKEISNKNGYLNRQDLSTLKRICKAENLDSSGKKNLVIKRLKQFYKNSMLMNAGLLEKVTRGFDYLVVIDFEATCEEKNSAEYPHEIIEFPAVLIDVAGCKIVSHWRKYVHPVINPTLSEFCVALTGITQELVDEAEEFCSVLESFEAWLLENRLGSESTFALITDGPFDVGRFLRLSCLQNNIQVPYWASRWINLRKGFANFYRSGFRAPGLQNMLNKLDLKFQGNPHCGLDDATNIARVAERLLRDGANLRVNERLELAGDPRETKERRLQQVVSVSRKEAEDWLNRCRKEITAKEE